MNITFFIGGLSGGGAERVTCNLANFLSSHGDIVSIVTMSDDDCSYHLDGNIKRIVLINKDERKNFIYNAVLRFYRFSKYLLLSSTDVYVVMLPITIILLLQMKWLTGAKIIAAERSNPDLYSRNEKKSLRRLAKKADGWVFQTNFQKNWYGANISNGVIIPNAINTDFIKPIYDGARNKRIVTVGSLSVPKNHELLINAFSIVKRKYPDYELMIYGKGPKLEKLQHLAKQLGVDTSVYFPGYCKTVGEEIKYAAVFVLSSDFEGMPNALMEAMAIGLPCVSTDCDGGGARELIKNNENGILVPKGDTKALADAIIKLIDDKDFAMTLGKHAHDICQTNSPSKIYGEWEDFINQVAAK